MSVPLCGKGMSTELLPKAETSDYCFPDEEVARTDIGITYLGISCGPSSIEAMQSLVAGRPAYNDRTDLVLVAKAGMNVKVTPKGIGRGTHSFSLWTSTVTVFSLLRSGSPPIPRPEVSW